MRSGRSRFELLLPLNLGLTGKGWGAEILLKWSWEMRLDMAQAQLLLGRRPLVFDTNHISMWTVEHAMVKLPENPSFCGYVSDSSSSSRWCRILIMVCLHGPSLSQFIHGRTKTGFH